MEIRLTNICKTFNDNKVLENINITFKSGEITCIMGSSGRGKTTLVNIIAGLLKPDLGEISGLEGKKISMVFQEDRLLNWETALRNITLVVNRPVRQLNIAKCVNQQHARELLTQAGLADSINKIAAELSGGMKRRVCICRALIAEYDLLIFDEPFKGLDSGIKPVIMDMVKARCHKDKIILCITHDPLEAEYLEGRVIALDLSTPIKKT